MIDFTSLSAALHKVIRPAIVAQMYARAPMWQLLGGWSAEKQAAERANVNVDRFENNKMYMPIRTSYHSGYAAVGVSQKYNYGQPNLAETYAGIKTLVSSFTIPKQVLNVTNVGAIIKPLKYYGDTMSRDLAMQGNRQVYQDGSGKVATAASTGSGDKTVALEPSTNGDINYARYLPPGSVIQFEDGETAVVDKCTGKNEIVLTENTDWTAGDGVYLLTGEDTPTKVQEVDGFLSMIAGAGAYQALDPADDYSWAANVSENAETLYRDTIVEKIHEQFFSANSVGNVKWIVMNAKAFRTYGLSQEDKVRYAAKEVLSGGWKGLDYMQGNAQILLDYDCPDDTILGLTAEDLVFGEFQPLEFEKGTDGQLLKIAGKLDYEVTCSWMGNIGTVARASHFALRNKTFDTGNSA